MNGAYFERLENEPLPEWAAGLECESWAQFSLQYILANPAVTCVLTETTDPAHMARERAHGPEASARRGGARADARFIDELRLARGVARCEPHMRGRRAFCATSSAE